MNEEISVSVDVTQKLPRWKLECVLFVLSILRAGALRVARWASEPAAERAWVTRLMLQCPGLKVGSW